jgi:segregation and condensation protein A
MEGDEVKLDDRIEYMLGMIEDRNEVPFEELFIDDMRRITVVVTFMALLELVRMQKVTFRQERNLEAIYVLKKAESRKAE